MKKIIYLLSLLTISNFTNAQVEFSFVGFGEEINALKHLEKVASDIDNIASGYTFNSYKVNDTLILTVSGPEKIIRKLTFNSKMKKCDFDQIIVPNCDQCSKKQFDVIVNDKKMRWKEISKNQYLSSIEKKTLLTVTYGKDNTCTIMTFTELNIGKDAYLSLYKDNGDFVTAKNEVTFKMDNITFK